MVDSGDKEKKNLENIEGRLLLGKPLDGQVAHAETSLIKIVRYYKGLKV